MPELIQIPDLRFPEYLSESYRTYLFDDIFLFSSGQNIKQSEASPEFTTPCVRYGELYHMYNEVIDEVINSTNLDHSELTFSEGDEILLPSAGEDPLDIGSASALTLENVAIGRTINILKPKVDSQYSQIFVSYYINQRLKRKISKLAKGVSISNVYNSDLRKLEITLPTFEEQQKIASFLAAVDKRIQLLKEKKKQLERYKRGVMQKVFSQEIRFKDEDGSDFPDWEENRLDDLYSFISTNSYSRENLNYEKGSIKNIHYGDIHTKFNSHFNIEKELVPFINEDIDLSKINEQNYLQEGDLVIADASEDYADIGKTIEVINLNDEKVLSGLHTLMARRKANEPIIGFAGHLMKNSALRREIMRIAQGTKVLSISTTRLGNLSIQMPCNEEQQKIASFLSSLDDSIQKSGNQIEESSNLKKGLLQKMFV